jgi:hypothetical protein
MLKSTHSVKCLEELDLTVSLCYVLLRNCCHLAHESYCTAAAGLTGMCRASISALKPSYNIGRDRKRCPWGYAVMKVSIEFDI